MTNLKTYNYLHMKNIFLKLTLVFFGVMVYAQQDPHYTQYMYNMNVINPAYAGSKENLSIGILGRRQWEGLQGAPQTYTFNAHMPVGRKVGLGLSVIADQIGPVKEQNVNVDFSYTLDLGGEHKLAFGAKAGASIFNINLQGVFVPDAGDPAFSENAVGANLNVGAGLFYYTDNYYISFSVPNLLGAVHLVDKTNGRRFGTDANHYFLTGGYVFDLSENVKFKPFTMLKTTFKDPLSVDFSTNFLLYEKFELGATYRLEDSFGAMFNVAVTPNVRIGYAYDHIVSNLRAFAPASHEVILLFDLNFPKKVSRSPRYF
jgi:type IX secretion system PorP/SprF family membrane protein